MHKQNFYWISLYYVANSHWLLTFPTGPTSTCLAENNHENKNKFSIVLLRNAKITMTTHVVAGTGTTAAALIGNPRRRSSPAAQSSLHLPLNSHQNRSNRRRMFSPIYASVSASPAPVTKPDDLVDTILSKVQLLDFYLLMIFFLEEKKRKLMKLFVN